MCKERKEKVCVKEWVLRSLVQRYVRFACPSGFLLMFRRYRRVYVGGVLMFHPPFTQFREPPVMKLLPPPKEDFTDRPRDFAECELVSN